METNGRSPKYAYTRDLLRIALAEGMTQDEIARLCRTTQSVVSAWANGKSKGRKEVLAPLLKRFGHRVNRVTARVYLVQDAPPVPWAETERGRLLTRLQTDAKGFAEERMTPEERRAFLAADVKRTLKTGVRAEVEAALEQARAARKATPKFEFSADDYEPITDEQLREAERHARWRDAPAVRATLAALGAELGLPRASDFVYRTEELVRVDAGEWANRHTRVVRVEGAVVWRHVLGRPVLEKRKVGRHEEEPVYRLDPVGRWIIHALDGGRFRVVVQRLRDLEGVALARWQRERHRQEERETPANPDRVLAQDDAACWISTLHGPFDVPGLIAHVEGLLRTAGPHDRAVVPFTLRKALVEHGYDVPDVLHLSAT